MDADFTIGFIVNLIDVLLNIAPVLLFLLLVIVGLSLVVGRRESWSRADSLYYGFVTATTVGYGDFHPKARMSKVLAIAIALTGLVLTGIVVAVAVEAVTATYEALRE